MLNLRPQERQACPPGTIIDLFVTKEYADALIPYTSIDSTHRKVQRCRRPSGNFSLLELNTWYRPFELMSRAGR